MDFWCDYGSLIEVGENFYAIHELVILYGGTVTFGDNVFIAPSCGFHTAAHAIDAKERNAGIEFTKPIKVGDDVWIGAGVQVMPGVTIGSNVVIGGGSVVVKDISDNSIAVGNPAKVIKEMSSSNELGVIYMKVNQEANCKNAPKNLKVAEMTEAILNHDTDTVNERYEAGLDSIELPNFDGVEEITILQAISHGKSASSLCEYVVKGEKKQLGMFFEFTTHKAEAYKTVILTYN